MVNNNIGFGNGLREALSRKTSEPDVMKVIAVLAVMWQGILGLMIKQPFDVNQKVEMIVISDLVKYSAPFFIFAICFDICKIKNVPYKKQLTHKIEELLIPYFCWATVYILMNIGNYKTVGNFFEGYFLGTSAPHTWYLVMMFQFHILVPVLWYLYAKLTKNKKITFPILIGTFIFYGLFLIFYDNYVFNVTTNKALIYLDRSFIGFSIYGILGTVASANYEKWNAFVSKVKLIALPLFFIALMVANNEMFSNGFENLTLANCIYLKPSTLFYNIFGIIIIYGLALSLIKRNSSSLPAFRFLSQYAFRAYLANFFVITILIKAMGESGSYMPLNLHLFLLSIMTAVFSFTIVYTIEFAVKLAFNILKGKRKDVESNNVLVS